MLLVESNNGERITYSNSGSAITAGTLIAIATGASGSCGVALVDIAATTGTGTVDVKPGKRFNTVPKASGEAFTQLQILYFDGTQLTGTNTTTNTRAGRAAVAAASADTTCELLLNMP
jgi:predicted RecA/RadA family phage recombinase